MTALTKTIKREVTVPRINRPVIITIDPDTKRLGFHEKGCRKVFWLPIATAFEMAVRSDNRGEI